MLRVRPIGAKYTDMVSCGGPMGSNLSFQTLKRLLSPPPPNHHNPQPQPLPSLLENDLVMRRFTCNHVVLERLLEFGYIREALSKYSDSSEYPRFLVRLLLRFGPDSDECRRNIVYAVCRRLYALSMESYGGQRGAGGGRSGGGMGASKSSLRQQRGGLSEEITVATVIPMLIRILDHDDEKVKVLAVASLVNFTRDNGPMKNVVMANGSIRRISRVGFCGGSGERTCYPL